MWFQMKLNPAPPDPAQKMIFDWMPVIFTFMLASFSVRPRDLLGVEQHAVGDPAVGDHAAQRRQDRIVGQSRARLFRAGNKGLSEGSSSSLSMNRQPGDDGAQGHDVRPACRRPSPPHEDRGRPQAVRRANGSSSRRPRSPASLPAMKGVEIAFAGRSNVGKSSLINALTNRNGLARTSQHAGPHPGADFLLRRRPRDAGRHAGLRLCRGAQGQGRGVDRR